MNTLSRKFPTIRELIVLSLAGYANKSVPDMFELQGSELLSLWCRVSSHYEGVDLLYPRNGLHHFEDHRRSTIADKISWRTAT